MSVSQMLEKLVSQHSSAAQDQDLHFDSRATINGNSFLGLLFDLASLIRYPRDSPNELG
jgi:hypothetical protein